MIQIKEVLKRKTSSGRFIPEIDGLRFLAIITVVLFHLRTHLLRVENVEMTISDWEKSFFYLISRGGLGVNVFFGISGFILALPFAYQYVYGGKRVNIKSYFIRRLTRLEPPYIITLTIFLFAGIWFLNNSLESLWPHYLASLVYSHFFIYGTWSVINPVAWSLETEVQFYTLAPLIFLLFKLKKRELRYLVFVLIIIGSVLLMYFFKDWYIQYHLHKSLLAYLPFFMLGVLFAEYYLSKINGNGIKKTFTWDIIGIIATLGLFIFHERPNNLFNLLQLSMLFLVFISAFKGKGLNWFYTRKFIYITGGMCYTIYLIHYAFIAFITDYTSVFAFNGSFILNLLIQAMIILPLLYFVSAVFFALFEKPFMYKDWPNKLLLFLGIKSK